ncbi:Hypothetical protein PBC10988_28550 [Planctomycetales bacterium 10988]|nr:Hypothetical protein PBC10988_28550 [Planctomycetales bacterium 10988]
MSASNSEPIVVKNPLLAGLLAWLIPGLGHLYQGRTYKGILFLVCILGLFSTGVVMGGNPELGYGRVVYVEWPQGASLPQFNNPASFLCQMGTGLAAVPAMIQSNRIKNRQPPLLNNFMAPPYESPKALDDLHLNLGRYWELGRIYTMIAGLLNILVIYDACCGPALRKAEETEDESDSPTEAAK